MATSKGAGRYANEEVECTYRYPSDYRPKKITTQLNILNQLFGGIGNANLKLAEQPLPKNAEAWFAIPKWQSVSRTYAKAADKVLQLLIKQRDCGFWGYPEIYEGYVRQRKRKIRMLNALANHQKGYKILVVAAQFGLFHGGRSPRRARWVFAKNEVGLGVFEVGCMILVHQKRFQSGNELWADCAGDMSSTCNDYTFDSTPCFGFREEREVRLGWRKSRGKGSLELDENSSDIGTFDSGSASAFLPEGD